VAGLSTYAKNKILDHTLGMTAWVMPTQLYAALYTVVPTDDGGGTQVPIATGYSRQAAEFDAAVAGATANSNTITFTANGGDWGEIVAVGYFDESTGGNLILWDDLGADSREIKNRDSYQISIGATTVTLTNA